MQKKAVNMKKIIKWCIILVIVSVAIGLFAMSNSGYRGVVKEALRIHYGWESEEHLKDIATTDFLDRLGEESFVQGLKLYTIASIRLDTSASYLEDNEIQVTVELYNPDISFAIFTLVKTEDGKYLIQDLGFDA